MSIRRELLRVRRSRLAAGIALTAAAAVALTAAGEGVSSDGRDDNNPFHGTGDNGERVHVLPSPDVLGSGRNGSFAPRRNASTTYPASYGSGNLTYHGGKIMSTPNYYAIYWNSSVANSAGTLGYPSLQTAMSAFVGTFMNAVSFSNSSTDDFSIVGQYTDSSGKSPVPTPSTTYVGTFVDTKATQTSISDTSIRSYLAAYLQAHPSVISSQTLYGIYFPSGMRVTSGRSSSCTSFCGYHSRLVVNNVQIKYAVYPFPDCSGCKLSNLGTADMLTILNSHEIREAVTDPGDSGISAWYDSTGYEADDKCAWHNLYQLRRTTANLRFWVQPEYSNGGTVQGVTYPGPGCVVPQ